MINHNKSIIYSINYSINELIIQSNLYFRSAQAGGTGKKIMKYINKITASNYFQRATELKYIKKAMTEVSNTPLVLTVEVQKLNGTMAINIPPPPSDRLWYASHRLLYQCYKVLVQMFSLSEKESKITC